MIQLTYISTAARGIEDHDVEAILAASRRNNLRAAVTGLLLYDGRRFLQVLEGDALAVEATYARIKRDERHRAPVLLGSRQIEERSFGSWAMACERVVTGDVDGGIDVQVNALTAALEDKNLRELFRSFAIVRSAA